MKIELHQIPVRKVVAGYKDSQEAGVVAYGGRLDIRPPYQREFVYDDKKRNAVLDTVTHGFPLNVMYWMKKQDGGFEVLDGQQRTLSICQYVNRDYSIGERYFHNLTDDEQASILDYNLMVYWCEGTDKERLDWFEVVNTAGEVLTQQELLNAVYSGPWLTSAKLLFSKTGCVAKRLADDRGALLNGTPIRQDYLETALKWRNSGNIKGYMATHQHDKDADDLWRYFQAVVAWVRKLFPDYRKEMKGVAWGELYNDYKDGNFSASALRQEVATLMEDSEVTKKSGIYRYVFTRNPSDLNLRDFPPEVKREAWERQKGICVKCGEYFKIEDMDADHITPWVEGGKTSAENCQLLCRHDNRQKGAR